MSLKDRITKNHILGLALASGTVAADQAVKLFMLGPMRLYERQVIEVLPFFDLRYATNPGISYGLFAAESLESRIALFAITGVIALGVLIWMFFEKARADIFALSLVLGGAIGNIIDRLRLTHVIDYADFHIGDWRPFAVFNLADVAITLGVVLLLARTLFIRDKSESKTAQVSAGSATE
ncbi:signal peptidase II [Croceicoccus mobilis]|uniref:Lipoprotein signal peptidase n=1 Tax=Croceicoccus mobilis TaxID=1703339 RepID=A0A916YSS9_9SPHN|nr:signal peptidase II [Croceicoccus mobilis]GGD59515.1 lipoprotein signal peptidase [Croceicoccus mobilis]